MSIIICHIPYPLPYLQKHKTYKEKVVECCGERLPADADLLQRFMTVRRLPLEEQMALWRSFYRQWPDPEWARICLDRAREIKSLLALDRSLFPGSVDSASSAAVSDRPLSPTAERHFVWLGDRYSIGVEPLRDGISRLAEAGLIASDRDQQAALRRCLGLALNEQERSSNPPWVLWIGPSDMLNHLVDTLWQLQPHPLCRRQPPEMADPLRCLPPLRRHPLPGLHQEQPLHQPRKTPHPRPRPPRRPTLPPWEKVLGLRLFVFIFCYSKYYSNLSSEKNNSLSFFLTFPFVFFSPHNYPINFLLLNFFYVLCVIREFYVDFHLRPPSTSSLTLTTPTEHLVCGK